MEIRARDNERELLLELSGEIDHHGARNALKEVEMAIDAALPRLLILDFSGVTFMDSSGIALILRSQQRMQLLEGSVVTATRTNLHHLVTEYGIFNAKGKSTWERAEAIISIAHPDFREQLIADAEKMHIWRKSNKK